MTYENEWAPMIISKVIRRSFGVELRADDVRDILEKEKHGNGYTD